MNKMTGYWFFPIFLFGVSLNLILSKNALLLVLLVWGIFRIYRLQSRLIWFWSALFFVLALFWGFYNFKADQKIRFPQSKTIIVNPNTVKVNGDLAQMRGVANRIPVVVTAKLNSEDQKKQLEQNVHWFKLQLKGDYEQIEPPHNEGEFNYQQFEHRQKKCDATAFFKDFSPQKIEENWWQRLISIRRKISIYLSDLPKYSRYFLKMMTGEHDDLIGKEDLSRVGLLSIFSLSGMQLFFWLDFWKRLGARLRITVEIVNGFILLFLALIIVFNFQNVGLTRSAIFLFVAQLMELLDIKYARLDVWSFTAFIFMLFRPYLLFSLGGILSFLITFFIQTKSDEKRWITNVKISLLMLPVILQQVFVWNILSLVTNFIFFPLVSFLFPLFSLNLIFHFPIFNQMTNFICQILYYCIAQISNWKKLDLVFGQISVNTAIILVVIGLFVFNKKGWNWKGCSYLAGIYLVSFLMIHFPISGRVVMFDIGQGDSLLIETPFHRQVILIDTGGKLALKQDNWQKRHRKSRVETITLNYLHSRGINHLDAVVTTHQDADHIGDLPELIKKIRIDRLIYGQGILGNPRYLKKVMPLKNTTQFMPVEAGNVIKVKDLPLTILNPSEPGLGENTDSVTFSTHLGKLTFLFTGDLDQEGENRIMKNGQVKADILKVGHHGSKTSTSSDFLKAVSPRLAWISVGRKNRYGHPSPEVLRALDERNIPWLATKDVGMVYYEYNTFKNKLKSFGRYGSK